MSACRDCGEEMTQEEAEMYEYRCETCERAFFIRVEAWRHGGDDPELDRMFDGHPQPWRTVH